MELFEVPKNNKFIKYVFLFLVVVLIVGSSKKQEIVETKIVLPETIIIEDTEELESSDEIEINSMEEEKSDEIEATIEEKKVETKLAVVETQPVVIETQPAVVETQPIVIETQPAVVETQPVVIETQPIVFETTVVENVKDDHEPVIGETKVVNGKIYEFMGGPGGGYWDEPVIERDDPDGKDDSVVYDGVHDINDDED